MKTFSARTALIAHWMAGPAALAFARPASDVPSPEEWLGRPVGTDFELSDWEQVEGYWRAMAAASDRVRLEEVGRTSEGRPFLLGVISSPENLARLGEIEADAARVADPRGLDAEEREALLERAPVSLFVSLAMHATECAAVEFGMDFAYHLAVSDEEPYASARQRIVIYMPPSLNPDGVDHVTHWYRRVVHTADEGADLTELYQAYAGHDNNRDWFALALPETRLVTGLLYGRIHPQVYWDVHQQGSLRERFFVPPYRDPLNPNLDPAVVTAIGALGARALHDMTRAGLTGISTGVSYDMWWNGGNRSTPARRHVAGILTEAASANLASPVFLPLSRLQAPSGLPAYQPSVRFPAPWPGGWWRIGDIVAYEHAFGRSLLEQLAREPRAWVENVTAAAERTVARGAEGPPVAFVIGPSPSPKRALRRLVEILGLGGVEVQQARAAFVADGRTWPRGTLVVSLDQPQGTFVKDLFERQKYPAGERPYDVAGWTLPALFGLEAVEVHRPFEVDLEPLSGPDRLAGAAGSVAVWRDLGALGVERDALPRIGVVAPWRGVRGEGWMRWFLDSWQVPFERVRYEELRAGALDERFDVLFLTSLGTRELEEGRRPGQGPAEFGRGLDLEGALALERFVRSGGVLVAAGASADYAIETFGLPLVDTTRGARGFACPGSVLRTAWARPEGRGEPPAVLFAGGSAYRLEQRQGAPPIEVLLSYASTRLLLSGWIEGEEVLAGQAAWVRAQVDDGQVHVLGFEPQYRGWTEAAFAALLGEVLTVPHRAQSRR